MCQLLKRNWNTKCDALLEGVHHDLLWGMPHASVQEHGILSWAIVRYWECLVILARFSFGTIRCDEVELLVF